MTHLRRLLSREYAGLLGALLGLVIFFGLQSDYFWSALTLTTLANQIPSLTVIAVGMTFVLIIGGIDLSVGSVMALGAAVLGVALVELQLPLWLAGLMCLATGLLCGCVNGFVVTRWSVPSFIVTLGMLEMARGGAYLVTDSQTLYIGSAVGSIGSPLPGINLSPALLLTVLVVIGAQVLLRRSIFGRYMIAVGSNEEAVRLAGIDVARIKLAVFCLAGLLAGLGGLFQVGYLQSADPNAGIGLELSAIAAVVIGGTSLSGGKGSVVNTFLGVLIIAVLQTGLAQIGASEPSKRVITGLVIITAVILDVYRNREGGVGAYLRRFYRSFSSGS
ncbi:MAG: ABC transporter permease [Gammaproteobacteria bacterium]|nr:MAG: ABC transporter permease [Gammaproteobacteria bacterium]